MFPERPGSSTTHDAELPRPSGKTGQLDHREAGRPPVWWDGVVPSLRHDVLARGMPRLRKSSELDSEERERERLERWHAERDRALPTNAVVRFRRRYEVQQHEVGEDVRFPVFRVRARGSRPRRRVLYLHGGGYVAPLDPFHVRYAARLASAL